MKISRNWLSDFIEWTQTDPQVIADTLTATMGEIDEVEVQGALLDKCVVGKVISVNKHPNADKLSICDVETDDGVKKVVCGGTNVRPDMLVAFAHVGATVKWHGGEKMTLAPVKIRDEQSEGMICAGEELGIETMFPPRKEDGERAIVDLSEMDLKPGTPLKDALGLSDVIFHIDNHAITNRPDLFSHLGVARECVAAGLAKWKKKTDKAAKLSFPKNRLPFQCINDIPTLIPRYAACLIQINETGTTPEWMKQRLQATGSRSINLPIDITNYVMMELGMPLHSFDADDFKGDIHMRTAKAGEKITTLDGIERELPEGAIVISDDEGIFDLLGIMGGLRSSTKDSTKHIYLHSARVDGASIRKSIIATGHRTDAATVYEKGIPSIVVEQGFQRALELILEHVPGAKIISKKESSGKDSAPRTLSLSPAKVQSMIGTDMSEKRMKDILSNLEFKTTKAGKDLKVTVPGHRLGDITGQHDLIEEVARIEGYNVIPPQMPVAEVRMPERDQRMNELRDVLKIHAYTELIHLAFANEELLSKSLIDQTTAVRVSNPLGEELSLMRPHLLPSMLVTAGLQLREKKDDLKIFEYGHIFNVSDKPDSNDSERTQLALLVASKYHSSLPNDPLLQAKADAMAALKAIGCSITVAQRTNDVPAFAHPGRFADILCEGIVIGSLFEVHPSVRSAFDISERAAACVIEWDALAAIKPTIKIFKPLPAFPAISYDETIAMPSVALASVMSKAKAVTNVLKSIEVIDLYEKDADKRITLRFEYRADDKTLTQAETDIIHTKVSEAMKSA